MANVKTKKRIFNAIMACAAVAIVAAGVMLVLDFKGGSNTNTVSSDAGSSTSTTLTTCEKSGNVNIVRGGLGYALENNTALKAGDQVETLSSSGIALAQDGVTVCRLGARTTATVQEDTGAYTLSLTQGTALVWAKTSLGLMLCDKAVQIEPSQGALLLLSQEQGSASVAVLGGSVVCKGVSAQAQEGSVITFLKSNDTWQASVDDFSSQTLQDATIQSIKAYLEVGASCVYSADDLQKIVDDRATERGNAQQEAVNSGTTSENAATQNSSSGSSSSSSASDSSASSTESGLACTIEIRCDTILNNMGDLTSGKEAYVPANGTILATSTVSFSEGDTVFDVLTAACKAAGIQLEYTFSTMYGSNYIEGINNLYEFDCGEESGWMYKVNGWFPNYGCSKYELHDGDVIVWCYTCKGLGADVGGGL